MNKAFALAIITAVSLTFPYRIFAQMENNSYILETDTQPSKHTTANPTAPSQLSSTAEIIQGNGFTAVLSDGQKKSSPLFFTVSDITLSFGNIKPGEPLTRTQIITLDTGSANQAQVLALQTGNLRSSNKNEIPNTSCDNGNCTNLLWDTWSSPLTYGFGYNCENVEGLACDAGIKKDLYRRFSSSEVGETASLLLSSSQKKTKSLIEYKMNIPGNQPDDSYSTIINFLASPAL